MLVRLRLVFSSSVCLFMFVSVMVRLVEMFVLFMLFLLLVMVMVWIGFSGWLWVVDNGKVLVSLVYLCDGMVEFWVVGYIGCVV